MFGSWRSLLRAFFYPTIRTYRRRPIVLRRRTRLFVESLEVRVTPAVNAMIDAQKVLQITYVGDDTANLAVSGTGAAQKLNVTDQNSATVGTFNTSNFNAINIVGNVANKDVASFNSDFLFANNNLQTITEKQLTSVRTGSNAASETIATTDKQTYNDAFILADNATFNTTGTNNGNGADLTFLGAVDGSAASAQSLSLTAGAGTIHFAGLLGGMTPLGTVTINAANKVMADQNFTVGALNQTVASTSDVTFSGKITTAGAMGMAGGNITLNAGGVLTVTGAISAVGGAATGQGLGGGSVSLMGTSVNVTSIDTSGSAAATAGMNGGAAGAVALTATQAMNGVVTINSTLTAKGGSGMGSGVQGAGSAITLVGDEINLSDKVSGNGSITLQPLSAGRNIQVGDTANVANALNLLGAEINQLQTGFQGGITIGRTNGTGTLTVAKAVTFNDSVTLQSAGMGGSLVVNDQLTGAGGASITLRAANTTLNAAANVNTTGTGNIQISTDNETIKTGAKINANTKNVVTITVLTPGTQINLGGNTANQLGITQTDLSSISAGTLRIGDTTNAGTLNVTAAIDLSAAPSIPTLTLRSGGAITEMANTGTLKVSQLAINSVGPATLNNMNQVAFLAANITGVSNNLEFKDSLFNTATNLQIDTVDGITGITDDPTICMAAGDLVLNTAINAGTGTVRLEADNGAVSEANNTAIITAANLGVLATKGISLDAALNAVTGTFAANGGAAGNVKFKDDATKGMVDTLTIGTVAKDPDPMAVCFLNPVSGVMAAGDVTLCNSGSLVIGDPANVAKGGEVIVAGATNTVRLQATNGSITQTKATGAMSTPNTISGQNLGAFANNDILLDAETNKITAHFAAKSKTGNVKFCDDATVGMADSLTISTITADSCFNTGTAMTPAGVIGVLAAKDVTIGNSGDLVIGEPADVATGGEGITAGATNIVRLQSNSGSITQTKVNSGATPNTVTGGRLGVFAANDILLDQATNSTGVFAAKSNTGNIKFCDGVTTLTIGMVAPDSCFTSTVRGVKAGKDVTIGNSGSLVIGDPADVATGDEGITAGATNSVRLQATNGSITQTKVNAGVTENKIVGANLGAFANNDILLDKATNTVTGVFAAKSNTGSVKFCDGVTTLTIGMVSTDSCFTNAVKGVTASQDVTIGNSGNLVIGDPNDVATGSEGITAGAANTVRLQATNGSITQTKVNAGATENKIVGAMLGVFANNDILLDKATNTVTGVFAAESNTGSVKFCDGVTTLTIGMVSLDSCFTGTVKGVTAFQDVTIGNTGSLIIGNSADVAIGGEGIAAGAVNTVRLQATNGSITQTQATGTGATPNTVADQNLGVSASSDILLDKEVNKITGRIAAISTSGSIKFCDDAATMGGNTLTTSTIKADSCFSADVRGIQAGLDVTVANTGSLVIGDAADVAMGGEGVTAGAANTVRLQASGGSVTQTAHTSGSANTIQGQNLGVLAANDILLDRETNKITGHFAADGTNATKVTTGDVKFLNDSMTPTTNTLTIASVSADSCFNVMVSGNPTGAHGIQSGRDATVNNTGDLVIGTATGSSEVGGQGVTANRTVRLISVNRGIAETKATVVGSQPNDISSSSLGARAKLDISLNEANVVSTFAATAGGSVSFMDGATALTIATVDKDGTDFAQAQGVKAGGSVGVTEASVAAGTGDLIVGSSTSALNNAEDVEAGTFVNLSAGRDFTTQQLVKSGGTQDINLTSGRNMSIVAFATTGQTAPTPSNVALNAGTGKVIANVGQSSPASDTVIVGANLVAKEAQFLALPNASTKETFQIRPTSPIMNTPLTPIHVVGETPITSPGDSLALKLGDIDPNAISVKPQFSASDPNMNFLTKSSTPGARNLHGTFSFVDTNNPNMEERGRIVFEGIESLGGLSLTATSIQTTNKDNPISVKGTLQDTTGGSGTAVNLTLNASNLSPPANAFLLSPSFVSPTSPFSAARLAVADINGDGVPDLIIANGPGNNNPPTIRVIDGNFFASNQPFNSLQEEMKFHSGQPSAILAEFTVFDARFRGGLSVSAGVLNPNTNKASIVVGLESNGPPVVSVFDFDPTMPGNVKLVNSFQAYDSSFQGGVRVAVGSAPGNPIVVVAPGPGAAMPVEVYNAILLHDDPTNPQNQHPFTFFPYGPTYTGGVVVDAGNSGFGSTFNDILTGNELGQPHIRMFSSKTTSNFTQSMDTVAFQPSDTLMSTNQTIASSFPVHHGVLQYVPPNGVSTVSFGAFASSAQKRDIIVGAGVGKQAQSITLNQTPHLNPPPRRTAWAHGRVPRGIHIGSGGA